MPYRNPRNVSVAEQVNGISQAHINRENEINDFQTSYEIPSKLESAVMRYPEVHGGSGFAASTVQDLGFEPTLGPARKLSKSARGCPPQEFRRAEFLAAALVLLAKAFQEALNRKELERKRQVRRAKACCPFATWGACTDNRPTQFKQKPQ